MQKQRAFYIGGIVVVIAIIWILVSLYCLPYISARESARRVQCTNNSRQLTLATLNYHDVNKVFPRAGKIT